MSTMILSSAVTLFNNFLTGYLGIETYFLIEALNFLIGFSIVMLLFALMFKMLPDVEIGWKPVWRGAFLTAVLFILGKILLSFYFSELKPTSAFGAAGTVILVMLWINYSCMLIFFGVEFTKIYAYKKNYKIAPSKHAKWSSSKLYNEESSKINKITETKNQ